MSKQSNSSVRTQIMSLVKTKFGSSKIWNTIESDVALRCAGFPEPISQVQNKEFLTRLQELKTYLMSKGIDEEDTKFLKKEIEMHQECKMLSSFIEKDDGVEAGLIEFFSKNSKGQEGIMSIPGAYNFRQLSRLTNLVFDNTGLVNFYVSQEKMIHGKIIAEIYEHPQEVTVATVIKSKKTEKGTDEPLYKGVKLFGEVFSRTENVILREINLPLYVYQFISDENKQYMLLTNEQNRIGDYIVTGVETECSDYKALTDSAKLPTKLPFFFSHHIQNRIIQYSKHEEFKNRIVNLKIDLKELFDFPFCVTTDGVTRKLIQPMWYKWFIWAWLTHQPKGLINRYPLHILQIGPKSSGKSLLLNALHSQGKETRSIFSGSSSTLKNLIPSFKNNPAKLGYLAESNRFAYCDEFLRCLTNVNSAESGGKEETVAMMNDLLEHQKREAGSGNSSINVNMTARIIATTNPVRGMLNVENLIAKYDESFLSRWMVYYQTEEHVNIIRRSNDHTLEKTDFKLAPDDWVSFLDYLHSFSAEYDMERMEKILYSFAGTLSEKLNGHYDARHKHHIECLMDGIIKTRCMMELDLSFKATDGDYDLLEKVWKNVIKSWLTPSMISQIKLSERIFYLPEKCQYLYWAIHDQKKMLSREEVREVASRLMTNNEYIESYVILKNMGLLTESYGNTQTHNFFEQKEGEQTKL